MRIINEKDPNRLNSKKSDYVKYAFILMKYGQLNANQINYYYNKMFRPTSNALRVGSIIRQYPQYFTIINPNTNVRVSKLYEFRGRVLIPISTLQKWNKKLNP